MPFRIDPGAAVTHRNRVTAGLRLGLARSFGRIAVDENLDQVSIRNIELVTQSNVGEDFDHATLVVTGVLSPVRSEDEASAIAHNAGNEMDDAPDVLGTERRPLGRKRPWLRELEIEAAGIERHSRRRGIRTGMNRHPMMEVIDAGRHSPHQQHVLSMPRTLRGRRSCGLPAPAGMSRPRPWLVDLYRAVSTARGDTRRGSSPDDADRQ